MPGGGGGGREGVAAVPASPRAWRSMSPSSRICSPSRWLTHTTDTSMNQGDPFVLYIVSHFPSAPRFHMVHPASAPTSPRFPRFSPAVFTPRRNKKTYNTPWDGHLRDGFSTALRADVTPKQRCSGVRRGKQCRCRLPGPHGPRDAPSAPLVPPLGSFTVYGDQVSGPSSPFGWALWLSLAVLAEKRGCLEEESCTGP